MASAPLDDAQVNAVVAELDKEGNGKITHTSFSDWMMRTYTSFLKDPSLIHDSVDKIKDSMRVPEIVYNQ